MTIIEAIIAGVVQGITEFLPVSSSGHLVMLHSFFGIKEPDMFFDICLHGATLLAIILYFSKDILELIKNRDVKMLICIAIGTVPAVGVALLFEDRITSLFGDPVRVSVMLLVTGLILLAGQFSLWFKSRTDKEPGFGSSVVTGLAQACALLPGISRSGTTICAGLLCGIKPKEAFRFSFLLAIPAIAGAVAYKAVTFDAAQAAPGTLLNYSAGMAAAFVTGFVSLKILWKVMEGKVLIFFAAYCFILGLGGIMYWK
ncbi:MAG: undecaprenyl-diphosphate phosphatase [Candidatus Tantalella remota]|nr:undecaprenyl-diphosphate phosphatase [Candidatus Tantalella remota]